MVMPRDMRRIRKDGEVKPERNGFDSHDPHNLDGMGWSK